MGRPLSILYTSYNEIDTIGRSLETVMDWSDDLTVVDSFSTDGTYELLQEMAGVQVVQRHYTGPAEQKNWAVARARHPWVLLLDADEWVTADLRREIEELLDRPEEADAYWIYRDNYFMGRHIRHSGWGNDRVVRFFHRDRARYNDKQVHEEIVTKGLRTGELRGRLEHHTFKSLDHFLDKTRRYARWSARDHAEGTGRVGPFHLLVKPTYRFLKHYILQGGFRDGREGLIISYVAAYGIFLRYAYLLAERKSPSLRP
jgi:glycosyltransferase involved in cell wall biosynthesis